MDERVVAKFAQILGIINNTFERNLVQKFSRIKEYNALAVPGLLCENEIWNLRKKDKKRLTSIEIKFFRSTEGYTLNDHKRYEEILEMLKVEPADE